eukprot:8103976-Pyramimonas_sp.AAC.2
MEVIRIGGDISYSNRAVASRKVTAGASSLPLTSGRSHMSSRLRTRRSLVASLSFVRLHYIH